VLLGCLVLGGPRSAFCQQPNGNRGSGARLESNQREGASRSPKGERQPAGAAEKEGPPRKTHG
jgi:hypothetical protein